MYSQMFTASSNITILEALKKIDKNKKGFLIVIDHSQRVIGTLTDGDIRRAFIKGHSISDFIETIYKDSFIYVKINDDFNKVIEIFKNYSVNFLPILNNDGKLVNLITKKEFHTALIEDIEFNLEFNFSSLDELTIDHEIYNRPWGFYKTTFLNPYAQAKIIKVFPKGELSLQEHKKREEHWVIISGEGELTLGESIKKVYAGDYIYIPKGCKHRIKNTSINNSLMVSEVQLGEYFGEDDIVRYEDKYGRIMQDNL